MPGSHTHVRPKRHTNYSVELMTNVRGTHGHEAYCACGWVGTTFKTPGEAQGEARWHYGEAHAPMNAALEREAAKATGG